MVDTYSAKPFISYDGVDENGVRAEVKVVTGYGHVDSIEPSKAGKSFKVAFRVGNSEYLPAGWAPDGSNVLNELRKAEESGEPIHFRIETRRQKHVDRSLPMDQVAPKGDMKAAKENIHKSIAAVMNEGDDDWTISPHAVTRLDEDPRRDGNGIYSAYATPKEQLAAAKGGSNGGSAPQYSGIEPPPYVTQLSDGRVNPGSIAASVALNLLNFVQEWDREHDELTKVGERRHVVMARAMMAAANELQLKIWDGELEAPDLGAGSHTRARALVFEVTREHFPLGPDVVASKESLLEWKSSVVEKALAMWKWSIGEVESILNKS